MRTASLYLSGPFFTRDKEQALTQASQWRREGHRVQFRPMAFSADGSRLRKSVYTASAKNDVGGTYWFGCRPLRSGRCHAVVDSARIGTPFGPLPESLILAPVLATETAETPLSSKKLSADGGI
jgi:hypothetical protein